MYDFSDDEPQDIQEGNQRQRHDHSRDNDFQGISDMNEQLSGNRSNQPGYGSRRYQYSSPPDRQRNGEFPKPSPRLPPAFFQCLKGGRALKDKDGNRKQPSDIQPGSQQEVGSRYGSRNDERNPPARRLYVNVIV